MLAITNGKILTITQGVIEKGTILVENGKILEIGNDVQVPEGTRVIDAAGRVVAPGIIDAHAHVGIWEEGFGWEGNDVNEMTDPVTPHLRTIDAINPEDQGLRDAYEGGITAIWSAPGSGNVIGGEGVAMKTAGKTMDAMIIKAPAGLKAALGENPKRVYSGQKKMPSTRMGTAAVMREALLKGQAYLKKLEKAQDDPDKLPDRDLRMEAIARVLRKEIPLRTHAHRADDIITALRIAEEFDIDLTIEHCTEGHKVAGELARRNIKVVVGPTLSSRSKVELRDRSLETPAILATAGVHVSLMTDHPVIPIQLLPLAAMVAMKYGLSEEHALKALTINPAEICGIADRVGSLEKGKDADIVIWSGHPLKFESNVVATVINGEVVYQA
ncbi:MAG: amidohydrolase [Bacillota bacterium]